MSGAAIVVMVVAMVLIWGSLATSVWWAVRAERARRAGPGEPTG